MNQVKSISLENFVNMPYYGNSNQNKYKHLLVFDTPALLSAKKDNPEQDWVHNQELGECYVPGSTFEELFEKSRKSDVKAQKFIQFQQKWNTYQILQSEDNKNIPIPDVNQRDRKILASAFNLASENNNCVVVLVTYDQIKKVLINQKQVQNVVPNFCAIPARDLAWWYHN